MPSFRPRAVAPALAMLALSATLLAGCAAPPAANLPTPNSTSLLAVPTSSPTASPVANPSATAAPTTADIRSGIQRALNMYVRAHNTNDVALLMKIVDRKNAPFTRYVRTRFENDQRSFLAGSGMMPQLEVTKITPRELGFVQAHIETVSGAATDWVFRQLDGRWVLSEPTPKQLGAPIVVEREHFIFTTYRWADDVNERLMETMERARTNVIRRLGKAPDTKAHVRIKPSYGLEPFENSFYLANYTPRGDDKAPDTIKIYAPGSYTYGFYDATTSWENDLERILTHEYTHLVHQRSFDNAGAFSDWMLEGLAEFVSRDLDSYEVGEAVRSGTIIPIIDTVTPVYKQDLQHLATLDKDRSLAYGLAQTLVVYITEEHGGLEGFWSLARDYDSSQDLAESLQRVYGVSYEAFDQGWREWLDETYG